MTKRTEVGESPQGYRKTISCIHECTSWTASKPLAESSPQPFERIQWTLVDPNSLSSPGQFAHNKKTPGGFAYEKTDLHIIESFTSNFAWFSSERIRSKEPLDVRKPHLSDKTSTKHGKNHGFISWEMRQDTTRNRAMASICWQFHQNYAHLH